MSSARRRMAWLLLIYLAGIGVVLAIGWIARLVMSLF